jgi:hypothetical protein
LILLLLVALCATPAFAQSKPEVIYWPASKLSGYSPTLKDQQTAKKTMSASQILSDLGNHKFEILRRDGSGAGEQQHHPVRRHDRRGEGHGQRRDPRPEARGGQVAEGGGRRRARHAARRAASDDRRAGEEFLRADR